MQPLPAEVDAFLSRPNPAVMASLRPDGSPHTAAVWYGWADGRVLVNMDDVRARVRYLRRDGRVSLTVLADGDWYSHVTLSLRVAAMGPDEGLADYRLLAERYGRTPGRLVDRPRISVRLDVVGWYAWNAAVDTPR
jgi:PPOX class probable F420-dependent enzyme